MHSKDKPNYLLMRPEFNIIRIALARITFCNNKERFNIAKLMISRWVPCHLISKMQAHAVLDSISNQILPKFRNILYLAV